MDEFAKMIYEQWNKDHDNRDLFFKKGTELTDKMEEILSVNLLNDLYSTFCDSCQESRRECFYRGVRLCLQVFVSWENRVWKNAGQLNDGNVNSLKGSDSTPYFLTKKQLSNENFFNLRFTFLQTDIRLM